MHTRLPRSIEDRLGMKRLYNLTEDNIQLAFRAYLEYGTNNPNEDE